MNSPAATTQESNVTKAAFVRQRAPAVPIAIAVGMGIAIDHAASVDVRLWLGLTIVCLTAWGIALRLRRMTVAAGLLLGTCVAAGGAWHHLQWAGVRADHLAAYATEAPAPVRLVGRVQERPVIVPQKTPQFREWLPETDRTRCTIECTSLIEGERHIPVSGRARLEVNGVLSQLAAGDEIEVLGKFARPTGLRNPGGFDFRQYLRTEGIHVVIYSEHPECVQLMRPGTTSWRRWQGMLRDRCERLLTDNLSERTEAVGVAMLLGTRTGLSDELKTAFAESGTMHILAISGANVGILAGLLWAVCRVLRFGPAATAVVVLVGILGYAFVADAQPPVLRAVVMIAVLVAGMPWYRSGSIMNGIALAALGVLLWNPMFLFDVGAQLSFLTVIALFWAPRNWRAAIPQAAGDVLDDLGSWSWARRGGRLVWNWTTMGYVTVGAMWFFALPLAVARFQMFSPIGFVINVLLAPLMIAVLWCGYIMLLFGLVVPPSGAIFGAAFDATLRGLLAVVEWSASLNYGHVYLPGPSDLWLVGFYLCLAAVVYGMRGSRLRWYGWRAMLVWSIIGLAGICSPSRPAGLRCTFLTMGHGLSVLVELPNGRTLLYDAGQLQDGSRARQTVQSALWQRGPTAVDAIVISHADVDHFNAVPSLVNSVRIGAALVHPSFLDFRQESVRVVCDALAGRNVPIKLMWQGDSLPLDDEVSIRVLHPVATQRLVPDNANSLVVAIEYAGRTILLTGDLEKDGLWNLLRQSRLDVDILLAPHHGSLTANTTALADWSQPEWVVASGGRAGMRERLQTIYGDGTRVLTTQESGAVTFVISPDGQIEWSRFISAK